MTLLFVHVLLKLQSPAENPPPKIEQK